MKPDFPSLKSLINGSLIALVSARESPHWNTFQDICIVAWSVKTILFPTKMVRWLFDMSKVVPVIQNIVHSKGKIFCTYSCSMYSLKGFEEWETMAFSTVTRKNCCFWCNWCCTSGLWSLPHVQDLFLDVHAVSPPWLFCVFDLKL